MSKLFSANLEKLAVKAIASRSLEGQRLLSLLGDHHFATEAGSAAFARLKFFLRKKGSVPSWSTLREDPGLSDDLREELRAHKAKTPTAKEDVDALFESLDKYRKIRSLYEVGKMIAMDLDREGLDADATWGKASQILSGTSLSAGMKINHIGKGSNSLKLVREMLKGQNKRYIPTGFKVYDEKNHGFIRGSLVLIAAPSGNGKSIVTQTLAENTARFGAKTLLCPLEMDNQSVLQRSLSNKTGFALNRLLDPDKGLSDKDKARTLKAYRKMSKKIKAAGGRLSLLSSEEDVSIESVLSYAKSRSYDLVVIDYVGLLAGTDGDDQARALNRIARVCKIWASANNAIVVLAAQLSEDGLVRYSRALSEHASNMWSWVRSTFSRETNTIKVYQPKSRMQNDDPFMLYFDSSTMTVRDLTSKERKAMGSVEDDDDLAARKRTGGQGGFKPNQRGQGKGGGSDKKKTMDSGAYFGDL